jgi:hypothetical protein
MRDCTDPRAHPAIPIRFARTLRWREMDSNFRFRARRNQEISVFRWSSAGASGFRHPSRLLTRACRRKRGRRAKLTVPRRVRRTTDGNRFGRAAAARCDLPQPLGQVASVFRHAAPGRANWDAQSPLVCLPSARRRGAAPDTPRRLSCSCRRRLLRPGRRRPDASSARARGWRETLRQSPGGA